MLGLPRTPASATQLAWCTVAACRFLETLSSRTGAGLAAPSRAPPPPAGSSNVLAATQQGSVPHSSQKQADSGNVLGMLTSLLQQQQQSSSASLVQHQAAQEAFSGPASASAGSSSGLQGLLPNPSCGPDVSAASSGQVRMESQLVFDSCWRRFRERRGMDFAAPREIVWLNGAPGSGKVMPRAVVLALCYSKQCAGQQPSCVFPIRNPSSSSSSSTLSRPCVCPCSAAHPHSSTTLAPNLLA